MMVFDIALWGLVFCGGLLFWAYLGYPALMAGVAKCVRSGAGVGEIPTEQLPTVSVVIPAYNEQAVIEAKIRNALAIDYPQEKLQVLLACDGGDDRTAEIARGASNGRVEILEYPVRRGKASVVNDAVAKASGEVICLCDANVMFRPDAVRRLVSHLQSPEVGAVSGDVRLDSLRSSFGQAERIYYRIERAIQAGESQIGSMMGVDGGMYVIRRDLFEPLPPDTLLDDFTISMGVIQKGKRILYDPEAIAEENATEAALSEYHRRIRLSAGAAQVMLRGHYPPPTRPVYFLIFLSHKVLRWLSPFIFVAALLCVAALSVVEPIFLGGLLGAGFVTLLAVLGGISTRMRQSVWIAVPFYFALGQLGLAMGILRGIRKQHDPRWPRTERGSTCYSDGASRISP